MAIYTISDLHLSYSVDKPMDIFGSEWFNYMDKIKQNWLRCIKSDDTVVIAGDISWATYLDELFWDFDFLQKLPGQKIILKGNHDYWWETMKKMENYVNKNNFSSIKFLHNNCFFIENTFICGTRGWETMDKDSNKNLREQAEDLKIFKRELQRMELSLSCAAEQIKSGNLSEYTTVAALHFPPFSYKGDTEFTEIFKKYKVDICIYGHLHGDAIRHAKEGNIDGIEYMLVSADKLMFEPRKLK